MIWKDGNGSDDPAVVGWLAGTMDECLDVALAAKADIAEVKAQIEAVKADLLKWLFGGLIA